MVLKMTGEKNIYPSYIFKVVYIGRIARSSLR